MNWDAPVITIRQGVWNKILHHGSSDKQNEQFGILLGEVYENPENNGLWLEIIEMIPAQRYRGGSTYVEVSAEEMSDMVHRSESLLANYPEACRLGWYHTHPGHTIFMSDTDRTNHRNVYRASWQIALVYDPRNNLYGFFAGIECESVPERNILILNDGTTEPNQVAQPKYQVPISRWIKFPVKQPEEVPIIEPVENLVPSAPKAISNWDRIRQNILRPTVFFSALILFAFLGYLLGRINQRKQDDINLSTPEAISSSMAQAEEQQWISAHQLQIIMDVASQVNQSSLDQFTRARLIGQLQAAINMDKNSSIAKEAQALIETLVAPLTQTSTSTPSTPASLNSTPSQQRISTTDTSAIQLSSTPTRSP